MPDATHHTSTVLLNHAICICTKDRPDALRRCLSAILKSSTIPQLIRIVDASANPVPLSILLPLEHHITLEHYRARETSLPAQRNQALENLPGNLTHIHFLDDDFYPEPTYFEEIHKFTQTASNWVMCGGVITNNQQQAKSLSIFHELMMIDSTAPGQFLPSGSTSEPQARDDLRTREPFKVDWISGCAMCIHADIMRNYTCRFDEQLKGYAQDEDLDFCLQAAQNGSIYVVPRAQGYHDRLSHKNNALLPKKRFVSITHRYYVLTKHHPGILSTLCFSWSQLWQFLILIRKSGRDKLVRATLNAWKLIIRHRSKEELLDHDENI